MPLHQDLLDLLSSHDLPAEPEVAPHDYHTALDSMLKRELRRELGYLLDWVGDACDDSGAFRKAVFKERFLARCEFRAHRPDEAIGFAELPHSATNTLIWHVAERLFKPKTFTEMLICIVPSVKKELQLTYEEVLLEGDGQKKIAHEGMRPMLSLNETPGLMAKACSLSELSYYVIAEEVLFDVRSLEGLRLQEQVQLYEVLRESYPRLCDRLYTHNQQLRALKEAIDVFIGQGRTPKDALESLIRGLNLGGQRMSGGSFASDSADSALKVFGLFYQSLPEAVKENLRQLSGLGLSLGSVIDRELEQGHCVETAALHLRQIVEANPNHPLLHQPVAMDKAALVALKKRHYKETEHRRDGSAVIRPPASLFAQVVQSIVIDQPENLMVMLMNFSPQLYEQLLAHATFANRDQALDELLQMIKESWLTAEQEQALVEALFRLRDVFFADTKMLYWAIQTNKSAVLLKALESLPEVLRVDAVKFQDGFGRTVLHWAIESPRSLKILLDILPEDQRSEVVKLQDENGYTVLHQAAYAPESLKILLQSLPQGQRSEVFGLRSRAGSTVLHWAATNPESLIILLESLPEALRLEEVSARDNNGRTVLHKAATNPESLTILLESLPEALRSEVIKIQDRFGSTALHKAATNPGSLKILLESLSKEQRAEAVKVPGDAGRRVLHWAAENAESLKVLLDILPEERRADGVNALDNNGRTALYWAAESPGSLKILLDILPEAQRSEVVKTCDKFNSTALHRAANNPESLKILLEALPKEQWTEVLKIRDSYDFTVMRWAAKTPESLKVVLEFLLQDHRAETISSLLKWSPEIQRKVYQSLDLTNQLKIAQPSFSWAREIFIDMKAGDNPYELVFESMNTKSCEEALYLVLQAYLKIKEKEPQPGVFFQDEHNKSEDHAIKILLYSLVSPDEKIKEPIALKGTILFIIQAWESNYQCQIKEYFEDSVRSERVSPNKQSSKM